MSILPSAVLIFVVIALVTIMKKRSIQTDNFNRSPKELFAYLKILPNLVENFAERHLSIVFGLRSSATFDQIVV